ncbi:MAG TPA: ATP-binding protein [Prolixibacteraceae bacterium]|jgi:hypothetical protein|nr:ATP-binding protein [Bacteroidales bacterium]HPJ78233.1 ATP-binding protein [Prolixibacteraceae bacterium]HRV90280.1 ATP-binding protein [Prolixibacteraceae bacterium]
MKTISDHILDIVQNSVKAGATLIEIIVREKWNDDLYTLEIRDDGCGMDSETAARALEPFFTSRTTRKVGLGLPLLRQNAMQTGGSVAIDSEPGRGTAVTARFGYSHIDRPAMGDIAGVFLLTIIGHPQCSFAYLHVTPEGEFSITSQDLRETLGEVPLTDPGIMQAIRELFGNNLEMIKASK